MRNLLATVLLLMPIMAVAGDFSAHIPAGWGLDKVAEGDLNGDGQADAVLIIRQQDAAKRVRNEGMGASELDTNPRELRVLLRQGQSYQMLAAQRDWLPSEGDLEAPCLIDPLEEGALKIERGRLFVTLHYWLSCGSWGTNTYTYTFRMEGQRVRLIGLDHSSFIRNDPEATRENSINYLTGREKITEISGEGQAPTEQWRRLSGNRHFYIGERLPMLWGEPLQED